MVAAAERTRRGLWARQADPAGEAGATRAPDGLDLNTRVTVESDHVRVVRIAAPAPNGGESRARSTTGEGAETHV